jgi:hypothetical protein
VILRIVLVLFCLFLAACATTRWPTSENGQQWSSEYPVVEERYNAASKVNLGTAQDLADITQLVRKEGKHIKELRWTSASEVMVLEESGAYTVGWEEVFCVFEKIDGKWKLIATYLGMVA